MRPESSIAEVEGGERLKNGYMADRLSIKLQLAPLAFAGFCVKHEFMPTRIAR